MACRLLVSAQEVNAGMQVCFKTSWIDEHVVYSWRFAYRAVLIGGNESDIRHGVLHSL